MNLTAARELNKQEEAQRQLHLWAAILATHDALIAGGLTGLPAVHVERAKAAPLRAGDKDAGDYTDTELRAITVTSGARVWSEIDDGDPIFRNEAVVGSNGDLYITTRQHYKRSDLLPGSTAARTLFRLLRTEPEDSTVLDFVWGELVPLWREAQGPCRTARSTHRSTSRASRSTSRIIRIWCRPNTSWSRTAAAAETAATIPCRAGLIWRTATPSTSVTDSATTARPTKCFDNSSKQTATARPL